MSDQMTNEAPADVSTMTAEQANAEISNIMGDSPQGKQFKSDLMRGDNSPANRAARERWNQLHRVAGGRPVDEPGVQRDQGTVTGAERTAHSGESFDTKVAAAMEAPGSPDGYQIHSQGDPTFDPELAGEFRTLAHGMGLSQSDVDTVRVLWDANLKALSGRTAPFTDAELSNAHDESLAELAKRHGGDEGARKVVDAANGVLRSLPPQQYQRAVELLRSTGLANNVHLVERLAMVAQRKGAKR